MGRLLTFDSHYVQGTVSCSHTAVFSLNNRAYVQSAYGIRSYHLTCLLKGGCHMSHVGGFGFTSTGVILVLFILLVIVSRAFII